MAEDSAAALVDYQPPIIVWLVEYSDDRQPGWRFQAGAFTTEAEAHKLLRRLNETGSYSELSLNMIPVRQTVQDWDWDR